MISLKKSSLFLNKGILLKSIISGKGFMAFYDYFEFLANLHLVRFQSDLKFFNISTSFISFFFQDLKFFNFLRPGAILITGSSIVDFFDFNLKTKSFTFIGLVFGSFFLNLHKYQKIEESLILFHTALDIIFIYIYKLLYLLYLFFLVHFLFIIFFFQNYVYKSISDCYFF